MAGFSSIFTILSFFSLAFFAPLISSSCVSSSFTSTFEKIYAFGDSITDTGNKAILPGRHSVTSPPYGRTFFRRPANRFSDGRIMIDFVTQNLNLPFLSPYLNFSGDFSHGVNFAVGGSTAMNYSFFEKNNATMLNQTPQTLDTQLHWFDTFLKREKMNGCNAAVGDALFWVGEIGANDYAYLLLSDVTRDEIRVRVLQKVAAFLESLLQRGAKYVVVQGLPLLGCLPLSLTISPSDDRDQFGCVAGINAAANVHNKMLQSHLRRLRQKYPAAVLSYADLYNSQLTIMKKPASYGFAHSISACCGTPNSPYNFDLFNWCGMPGTKQCKDPSKYITWDGIHFSEAMHRILADLQLQRGFTRPSFELLLRSRRRGG